MAQTSVVPSLTVPEVTVPITTGTAIVTRTVPETIPVTVTTSWIQKSSEANLINDPKIIILSFDRDYFRIPVPDCGMKVVLPHVANDTKYGIRQPVPKLIALTEDPFNGFLNTFEGNYTGRFHLHLFSIPPCWEAPGVPEYRQTGSGCTIRIDRAVGGDFGFFRPHAVKRTTVPKLGKDHLTGQRNQLRKQHPSYDETGIPIHRTGRESVQGHWQMYFLNRYH